MQTTYSTRAPCGQRRHSVVSRPALIVKIGTEGRLPFRHFTAGFDTGEARDVFPRVRSRTPARGGGLRRRRERVAFRGRCDEHDLLHDEWGSVLRALYLQVYCGIFTSNATSLMELNVTVVVFSLSNEQ